MIAFPRADPTRTAKQALNDDVTRGCLAAVPDTSISGQRVVRELGALIARRGKPGMIVSNNGTELTSNAVLSWCGEIGVELSCSPQIGQ